MGLAYRDTDTNRVNALAKLEYKTERDASNATVGELQSRAWIASVHGDYHPSRPWWVSGRLAGKWQKDRLERGVDSRFSAQLAAARLVYDVTENWDVSILAAAQRGQQHAPEVTLDPAGQFAKVRHAKLPPAGDSGSCRAGAFCPGARR